MDSGAIDTSAATQSGDGVEKDTTTNEKTTPTSNLQSQEVSSSSANDNSVANQMDSGAIGTSAATQSDNDLEKDTAANETIPTNNLQSHEVTLQTSDSYANDDSAVEQLNSSLAATNNNTDTTSSADNTNQADYAQLDIYLTNGLNLSGSGDGKSPYITVNAPVNSKDGRIDLSEGSDVYNQVLSKVKTDVDSQSEDAPQIKAIHFIDSYNREITHFVPQNSKNQNVLYLNVEYDNESQTDIENNNHIGEWQNALNSVGKISQTSTTDKTVSLPDSNGWLEGYWGIRQPYQTSSNSTINESGIYKARDQNDLENMEKAYYLPITVTSDNADYPSGTYYINLDSALQNANQLDVLIKNKAFDSTPLTITLGANDSLDDVLNQQLGLTDDTLTTMDSEAYESEKMLMWTRMLRQSPLVFLVEQELFYFPNMIIMVM